MQPPVPVTPEEGSRADDQRMQQDTHLARLLGGVALPLALLAQRTRATTANAGRIDHTQTPISLSPPLLGVKLLRCWAAQRSIWLEREGLPREATRLPRRVAVVGEPYPDAGADEAGRVAACSLCGGMVGANSVVRIGVGSS
jgi:hypothetical protein